MEVCQWMVRRRLAVGGLTAHRLARNWLQPIDKHVEFTRERMNWTMDQWKIVLFSGECRIRLLGNDGRGRVSQRPDERFTHCCNFERVPHGGCSCIFWEGMSLEAKTQPVLITGPNTDRQSSLLTSRKTNPGRTSLLAEGWHADYGVVSSKPSIRFHEPRRSSNHSEGRIGYDIAVFCKKIYLFDEKSNESSYSG